MKICTVQRRLETEMRNASCYSAEAQSLTTNLRYRCFIGVNWSALSLPGTSLTCLHDMIDDIIVSTFSASLGARRKMIVRGLTVPLCEAMHPHVESFVNIVIIARKHFVPLLLVRYFLPASFIV